MAKHHIHIRKKNSAKPIVYSTARLAGLSASDLAILKFIQRADALTLGRGRHAK